MFPQNLFVLLAPGFEEIEAVTVVDVLRRAHLEVRVAAVGPDLRVEGAHRVPIEADFLLSEAADETPGALILPGGMPGAQHLKDSPEVAAMVERVAEADKLLAAICAAPWALSHLTPLDGRRVTCYPSFRERMAGGDWEDAPVVCDGALITSQGPATALPFALAIVAHFIGTEQADAIADGMLLKR